jgi:DNA mismatch repair protein MutS2
MNSTLLSPDYITSQDNIDLLPLLEKFSRLFKFHENHQSLKKNISPRSLSEIDDIYNRLEALAEIDNWQDKVKKSLQELDAELPFSLILKKSSKAQVLEVKELVQTYSAIKAIFPLQKELKLNFLEKFDPNQITKFFKAFFKEAELLFDFKTQSLVTYKHSRLKALDKKIVETNKELRSRLSKISSQWVNDDLLQANEYDILEDKFVLPVRSDRYNSNLGRIIYRSNSGNTLFIEPFSLRQLSNTIEELKAELEREIYKLLKFLSDELNKNYDVLKKIFEVIKEIDLCFGRLQCSLAYSLCRPVLNQKKYYKIEGVFHPLIQNPIKNDINIRSKDQGLLISGPNTGGKTVLLKSFCLCLMLPHLGFHVPAVSADLNLTSKMFFISHDNQSLMDGLSSFSSEALNYLEVLKEVDESSVIFIDEIFNTTSSLEASELAVALIKQITHVGGQVFISSHHESLKKWVYEENLIMSGHMGFTKGSNRPTYIFHMGSPGKSFAKEVFLGLEKEVFDSPLVTRWLGHLNQEPQILNEKIQDLDHIREESIRNKEQYEKLLKEVENKKEQVKNLLEIEKKKLESQFDKRWQKLKKETLDLTDKIKRGEVRNIVKVSESLNNAKETYQETNFKYQQLNGQAKNTFEVGEVVIIKGLQKEGKVLKISKGKAQIETGKVKTWVPLKDLLGSLNKAAQKPHEKVMVQITKNQEGRGMVLDARGMRRNEFLNLAEGHILDVLNGDLPFVDIIHGFGDGVLKKSLYELLKNYSELKFDFIEGNMGTTRVELMN